MSILILILLHFLLNYNLFNFQFLVIIFFIGAYKIVSSDIPYKYVVLRFVLYVVLLKNTHLGCTITHV